jgi:hypothetical protein
VQQEIDHLQNNLSFKQMQSQKQLAQDRLHKEEMIREKGEIKHLNTKKAIEIANMKVERKVSQFEDIIERKKEQFDIY